MQTTSASNRLYRGEMADFKDAMRCVERQDLDELKFFDQYEHEFPEAKADSRRARVEAFRRAAVKCRNDYFARIKAAELALAKDWQQSDDEGMRNIGEALENGDYSKLSI
jgi:hypothetical protein